jgi:hypothetical protein
MTETGSSFLPASPQVIQVITSHPMPVVRPCDITELSLAFAGGRLRLALRHSIPAPRSFHGPIPPSQGSPAWRVVAVRPPARAPAAPAMPILSHCTRFHIFVAGDHFPPLVGVVTWTARIDAGRQACRATPVGLVRWHPAPVPGRSGAVDFQLVEHRLGCASFSVARSHHHPLAAALACQHVPPRGPPQRARAPTTRGTLALRHR